MAPEAGSPADWLRHARSDLALAKTAATQNVLRETLSFHAQQAAEKSLKSLLVLHGIPFPRTHNLTILWEGNSQLTRPPLSRRSGPCCAAASPPSSAQRRRVRA